MKRLIMLTVVLGYVFSSLYAQDRHYAEILSLDGSPVTIYADSLRTKIVRVLDKEEQDKVYISVSIRTSSSDMFGNKIWMRRAGELIPEFSGWVEKSQCYRYLIIDDDNCSYVYLRPDVDSPRMRILSSRGLLVNVIAVERNWMKVRFVYHKVIEGWARQDMLRPL